MDVIKTINKGIRTQYQRAYAIFGALRAVDMVIER